MKTENGRTVVDTSGKYYKEQYGVAEKYMQQQLRSMLDREVSRDTYTEPSNYTPEYILNRQDAAKGEKQKKTEAANMLGNLYYGTPEQIKASIAYFQGTDPTIKGIVRGNDRIIIERQTKNEKGQITGTNYEEIPIKVGGRTLSQKEFIQSASPNLAGINDIFTGLEQGSYVEGKPLSNYANTIRGRDVSAEENMSKGGGSNTSKMTTEQWNSKWDKLEKGQTMVGLDGKTYTKK
jgi:hypothetical protein